MAYTKYVVPMVAAFIGITYSQGIVGDNCSEGWFGGLKDGCYKFISTEASWSQAKSICTDIGGSLVNLNTQAKNTFIVGYLALATKNQLNGCWWLGAERSNAELRWISDGSLMSQGYTDWDSTQPDNYMNQEDCVQLHKYYRADVDIQPYFAWNDQICSDHCSFVCEKRAV